MDGPPLHPDVAAIGFLLGSWMGEGKGFYNTIEPFEYGEEIRISHVGKPYLSYTQRAWGLDDGQPMHGEVGFWRMAGPTRVQLIVAHPNGHAEAAEGDLEGSAISLASTGIVSASTAKQVLSIERDVRLDGGTLTYDLRMAAVGQPLDGHLRAELRLGATH
jgi:hypothetical protein